MPLSNVPESSKILNSIINLWIIFNKSKKVPLRLIKTLGKPLKLETTKLLLISSGKWEIGRIVFKSLRKEELSCSINI